MLSFGFPLCKGALALLLAVAALHHTSAAVAGEKPLNTTGPTCEEAASAPGASQDLLNTLLAPITAAPTKTFCDWLLEEDGGFCNKMALIELGLTGRPGSSACDPGLQRVPLGNPTPFEDLRPLPYNLTSNTALISAEGETYQWLFRSYLNAAVYAPCAEEEDPVLAPGWVLHSVLNVSNPQRGADAPTVPFAVLAVQPDEGKLAINIRGTVEQFEWLLDFSWNLTDEMNSTFGAPVHWGVVQIFKQLWPGVEAALEELVVDGGIDKVFLTGHSLGAGTGKLVSYAAQNYLDSTMGKSAPVISAALFAPLNVGSPQFVELFNQRVNARRFQFDYDAIPQAPCVPSFPACTADSLTGFFGALSSYIIPTDQPSNVAAWNYSQIGGSIYFSPGDMPVDAASWEVVSNFQFCWVGAYVQASHLCSYSCFLGKFAPGPTDDGCWLSAKPAGAPGTQCEKWPNDYPGLATA